MKPWNEQHHPVYTIGKRGTDADFKVSREELQGAEVQRVPRGGETTFHGPGQVPLLLKVL